MAVQPLCVPVSGAATQVYNPAVVGTPSCTIFNNGTQPAYLGSASVTAATGLQLNPQQRVSFPGLTTGIWAVSEPGAAGTATTLSASAAAGAGTITVGSTSGFAAGNVLLLGGTAAAETVTVGTVPTGSTVVFTTGVRFGHLSGETLALASAPPGTSLNVLAGTH